MCAAPEQHGEPLAGAGPASAFEASAAARTAGEPPDLLVAGDAVPDVIVGDVAGEIAFGQTETLVERGALTVGGSSAIMACGAARLGLRVAFVGVVGDDAAGRFMLEELSDRGVDVSGCVVAPGKATGLTVHLVRPGAERDRAMLTSLGCVGDLTAAMVRSTLAAGARHLHVGSFYLLPALAPDLAELFADARGAGCTTSLDTQGDWEGRWEGGLADVLRETDVYFPNRDEALAVATSLGTRPQTASRDARSETASYDARPQTASLGERPAATRFGAKSGADGGDFERLLTALAALGPRPVVKCGAQGAVTLDGKAVVRAAAPAAVPVDTIGAGDSFDAGFVYGHLQGWPVGRSLAFGTACGSLSTRAAGGVEAQPRLEEALAASRDLGALA
jgi:sugar/nucleoside kinase (ribokinase family)